MTEKTKKILSLLVVAFMLITSVPLNGFIGLSFSPTANAAEGEPATDSTVQTGALGDNVNYAFDSATGALTISGSGKTYDYNSDNNKSPFFGNSSVKSVNILSGVTDIGNLLFYGCKNIESVILPDSLETIGNNSFCSCTSLKSIVIPDNVTTIGESAFQYTNLETVTLGESLENIGRMAFAVTKIKSIVIPDSVTTINYLAFDNCFSLESIIIGKGLKTIGNAAISRITSLKSITVSEENENFSSVDGVLFNKDKTKLLVYPAKKTGNIYFVPATVKTIGDDAFYGCTNIEMIRIPDSVENIGSTFVNCSALKKIALAEGISNITATSFIGCEALECIYVPSSVTLIGSCAFDECASLITVYRSGDVSSPSDGIDVSGGNNTYKNAAVVPNHTHTPESYYVIKDKSCTQDGSRIGICVCGKFFDEESVLAGHTFGEVQHKDADCMHTGYDYKQCTDCKNYFSSDAAVTAANGKADYSSFITQKLNHSYTGDIKMDTDGQNGTHSYKCVNGCGTYGGSVNHAWNNGSVTTPATHLKEGVKTYRCTCGATYTEPVAKLTPHSYTDTVVLPTCTEQGYTEHKCVCGDSYKDTYVDANGHSFENGVCTACGAKEDTPSGDEDNSNCDCICHNTNKFVQFMYKIVRWFWQLFNIHKVCDCSAVHY